MFKLDTSEIADELAALADRTGRSTDDLLTEVERLLAMAAAEPDA